jgi:hypothetical protein
VIEIYPHIQHQPICPNCGKSVQAESVLWQGIHTCYKATCEHCRINLVADLPVANSIYYSYSIDTTNSVLYGPDIATEWFGKPLLQSISNPDDAEIQFTVEQRSSRQEIVIVNCIDFLYGHSLLRLFNVDRHLRENKDIGVVVVIQDFLKWMVPEGVAEIWSVGIPSSSAQRFYLNLDKRIQEECHRFHGIFLSKAYPHAQPDSIQNYTGITPHDFEQSDFRITFIWREDREWNTTASIKVPGIRGFFQSSNQMIVPQYESLVSLFSLLRNRFPNARCTVAGLGTSRTFPEWIDDKRLNSFSADIEKELCQVYAESRVVIGVHGSHMLLPSAHAGLTVDLMPLERWGNFAQDVLFQETDSRISTFRYRFVPIATPIDVLAEIVAVQIQDYQYFKRVMLYN